MYDVERPCITSLAFVHIDGLERVWEFLSGPRRRAVSTSAQTTANKLIEGIQLSATSGT